MSNKKVQGCTTIYINKNLNVSGLAYEFFTEESVCYIFYIFYLKEERRKVVDVVKYVCQFLVIYE
mgnify:CR=1 FL=1